MKNIFIYYSYSNTLTQVAKLIEQEHSDFTFEALQPVKPAGKGFFNLILLSRQAIKGRTIDIIPPKNEVSAFDRVIIATPMWASHLPPTMRRYLLDHKELLATKELALLTVSGSGLSAKLVAEIEELLGRANLKHLGLKGSEALTARGQQTIKEWIASF